MCDTSTVASEDHVEVTLNVCLFILLVLYIFLSI